MLKEGRHFGQVTAVESRQDNAQARVRREIELVCCVSGSAREYQNVAVGLSREDVKRVRLVVTAEVQSKPAFSDRLGVLQGLSRLVPT